MRNKALHYALTAAMTFAGVSTATADGKWELPADPFETGIAPTNGAEVIIYNVGEGAAMTSGRISAAWATSAILTEDLSKALTFKLEEQSDGSWSIRTASGAHAGKYTFAPTGGDHPYMFVDMGWEGQGGRKWNITETDGGYTLALTGFAELEEEGTFMGTNGETWDVICNANPEDGANVVWTFVPSDMVSVYNIRCQMYEVLYEAEDFPSIDLTEYTALYNNSEATVDELTEALNKLKAALLEAQMQGGGYDPSPEDPLDLTESLLQNPTFDDDVNGWENIGGMSHDPNGTPYSGASYISYEAGEPVEKVSELTSFCEKWINAGSVLGKEYGIFQRVSLPEGLYRLEADAIACQQSDGSVVASGVTLYVNNATKYEVAVATANNSPKHYVIEFMSDGKTLTEVGFHIDASTNANWVAVDNFKLYSIGKTTLSAAGLQLQNAIKAAYSKFPEDEFDLLEAKASVKDGYVTTLQAAEAVMAKAGATDEEYADAMNKLNEAVAALSGSQADYAAMRNAENKFNSLSGALLDYDVEDGQMESTCSAIADEISQVIEDAAAGKEESDSIVALYNAYNALYELFGYTTERKASLDGDETIIGMIEEQEAVLRNNWINRVYKTPAEVAAAKDKIATMIANYLNASIKPNSDLTAMLVNPNFDENYDGWDYEFNGNKVTPGYSFSEIEYFQKSFNVRQTLKAMPKGRYTLTVQGYQRRSTVNAVLYANENEVLLYNVRDFANETGYFAGEGNGAYPSDSYDQNAGVYYPNSMEGARQWFDAVDEEGTPLYTNTLEFYLLDAEATDLTIGVKSSDNGDWCLFDNFTLFYHGNSAKDYADGLQKLIDELDELMADGVVATAKLVKDVEAAKTKANTAIKNNDADGCIASIDVLKNAIAEAKTTLALTKKLNDKLTFIAAYRMAEVKSSTKNDYDDYLITVAKALLDNTIADDDAVETIADEMDTKFTQMVMADGLATASEEKPFDITAVIVNPSYECDFAAEYYDGNEYNAFGWDGDVPNCNENCAEYFNVNWSTGVEINQTIKGLAPGYYKLRVVGYNRQGYGNDYVNNPISEAVLYAGDYKTKLHDVLDGKMTEEDNVIPDEEGQNISEVEIDGVTYYFPGNMPSSRACFDEGMYQNMLVFKVEEGQKQVTFGLSKTTFAPSWDSLMFDDWSLEYVGTQEPKEISTAIAALSGNAVSTKFYSVNGVEMAKPVKGINIIKTTDSKGNVVVSKVLVK
ncbi:MAG: hypothetical protein MJZ60_05990 [Bacteroidaceae bacterium]|nr:hypothetical protein [Bacteroidaceae bacterium]